MVKKELSPQQLVERFEDRRAVKNVIGSYAHDLMVTEIKTLFSRYWSQRDDVCLGRNDGFYDGADAVKAYYDSLDAYYTLRSTLYQKAYPEKTKGMTEKELYSIGCYNGQHLTTPIIEVAADGMTAKGVWIRMGSHDRLDPSGPNTYWHMGYYAVDFIYENDQWRIWHLRDFDEVDCIPGQPFTKGSPEPAVPEFAPMADFSFAMPNVSVVAHETVNANRPRGPIVRLPEAYESFADTFSYGKECK